MSFRLKLMLCLVLLIALTFGIGGAVLITTSFDAALSEQTASTLETHQAMQQTLFLLCTMSSDQEKLADVFAKTTGTGVQAIQISIENDVVYQNAQELLLAHTALTTKENQCAYTSVTDAYGHGLLVQSSMTGGDRGVALTARYDLSSVYTNRDVQLQIFYRIYIAVILIGVLTAAVFSYGLTRKLRKLTGAVRQIAGGELSVRTNLAAEDEFGQLSRDFDAMADHLQENIHHLEQEMERQEAFIGAFSHELKTPMTAMIGYADLLRQDKLKEEKRLMAADYIFSEGKRLERLSHRLLELLLLRKETIAMQEVSLHGFVQEIAQTVAPEFQKKNIDFTFCGEHGKVYFEPDLVKSLLYNLLDNAAKSMDGEGRIHLTAAILPNGCQFQVEDTGRGMRPEELERITEAFYRADKSRSRKQGGAGLGLALCKEIVRLHHGHMKFISSPETGTQVLVTLYGTGGSEHANG